MNINREELLGSCSEGEALAIYNKVKVTKEFAEFAKCFMYDADYQVARNMFWSLTKATDEELSQLQPMLHELVDLALATDNSSVRRLSLNIIERLKMEEDDLRTDFLDFCIGHMTDVNELPGIQAVCMKLAYYMSGFYPELMEELIRTVEGMEMEYYKPAVRCARDRILKGTLKKRKR